MPPTSRGAIFRLQCQVRYHQRRTISISKPSAQSRSLPSRTRTGGLQAPPSKPPNATYDPSTPGILPQQKRLRKEWKTAIKAFVIVGAVGGFILTHLPFTIVRIDGPSMSPTINPQCTSERDTGYNADWVLVQHLGPGTYRGFREKLDQGAKSVSKYGRGEVVVYNTPHSPEKWAVKRIVALPGDRVMTLDGYPSGEDAIVVPYNHVWVEGDVNDRKKSKDSNYFGPLSQALIRGRVVRMWSPGWAFWRIRSTAYQGGDWPARSQQRVEEDAVEAASANPDQVRAFSRFEGQDGRDALRMIEARGDMMEYKFHEDKDFQAEILQDWIQAKMAARAHPDTTARAQASQIVIALEKRLGRDALRQIAKDQASNTKTRRRVPGELKRDSLQIIEDEAEDYFAKATASAPDTNKPPEPMQTPAKIALLEVLAQKKLESDLVEKEYEARDKFREARGW